MKIVYMCIFFSIIHFMPCIAGERERFYNFLDGTILVLGTSKNEAINDALSDIKSNTAFLIKIPDYSNGIYIFDSNGKFKDISSKTSTYGFPEMMIGTIIPEPFLEKMVTTKKKASKNTRNILTTCSSIYTVWYNSIIYNYYFKVCPIYKFHLNPFSIEFLQKICCKNLDYQKYHDIFDDGPHSFDASIVVNCENYADYLSNLVQEYIIEKYGSEVW